MSNNILLEFAEKKTSTREVILSYVEKQFINFGNNNDCGLSYFTENYNHYAKKLVEIHNNPKEADDKRVKQVLSHYDTVCDSYEKRLAGIAYMRDLLADVEEWEPQNSEQARQVKEKLIKELREEIEGFDKYYSIPKRPSLKNLVQSDRMFYAEQLAHYAEKIEAAKKQLAERDKLRDELKQAVTSIPTKVVWTV